MPSGWTIRAYRAVVAVVGFNNCCFCRYKDRTVLRELLTYMIEDPRAIRRATYLLWVSHNLERIGDRAKNICERVIYVASGQLFDFDSHPEGDEMDSYDAPL